MGRQVKRQISRARRTKAVLGNRSKKLVDISMMIMTLVAKTRKPPAHSVKNILGGPRHNQATAPA
ncbi:MAG TPA: hypothetical protein DCZ13_00530, partial [Porticoccaceae bacterium]|nr:hypothetical protein [Porticoccaceae bacterium]